MTIARQTIEAFVCPADIVPGEITVTVTGSCQSVGGVPVRVISYGACIGSRHPGYVEGDGIFYWWSAISPKSILDGTANTMMAGETAQKNQLTPTLYTWWNFTGFLNFAGQTWVPTWGSTLSRLNAPIDKTDPMPPPAFDPTPADFARFENAGQFGFRSFHTNGGHFLMADGTVKYLAQDVDIGVYRALSTRNKQEQVSNIESGF